MLKHDNKQSLHQHGHAYVSVILHNTGTHRFCYVGKIYTKIKHVVKHINVF
jgi:hypothetical protein